MKRAKKAKVSSPAVMSRRLLPTQSLDFFPTPPWATRAFMHEILLARLATPRSRVWEPAAGEGHMAKILAEGFDEIFGSDVHDYGEGYSQGSFVGGGFDQAQAPWAADWIITNPPFNLAIEFALRAMQEATVGVALLVRSNWAEGGERYRDLFAPYPPTLIAQYAERVPMVAGRYDPEASTATSYAWFVWTRASWRGLGVRAGTQFEWIAPGAQARWSKPDDVARFVRNAETHPNLFESEARA